MVYTTPESEAHVSNNPQTVTTPKPLTFWQAWAHHGLDLEARCLWQAWADQGLDLEASCLFRATSWPQEVDNILDILATWVHQALDLEARPQEVDNTLVDNMFDILAGLGPPRLGSGGQVSF